MGSYKKLVRDNIPDIIKKNGEEPLVRILSDEEYIEQLHIKLQEEVSEYLESGSIEELADIEEVIIGILEAKGKSRDELEAIRQEKVKKRGAFKSKIYLEGVKPNKNK